MGYTCIFDVELRIDSDSPVYKAACVEAEKQARKGSNKRLFEKDPDGFTGVFLSKTLNEALLSLLGQQLGVNSGDALTDSVKDAPVSMDGKTPGLRTWHISGYHGFSDYDGPADDNLDFCMVVPYDVTEAELRALLMERYCTDRVVCLRLIPER